MKETYVNLNKLEKEYLEDIYWVSWENGYDEILYQIIAEIIISPDYRFNIFNFKEKHNDIEECTYAEIIYSLLVQRYGCFGITLRSGWIEKRNMCYICYLGDYMIEQAKERKMLEDN